MLKVILFILLGVCLIGASGFISLGLAILNTFLEDKVKERRKNGNHKRGHQKGF